MIDINKKYRTRSGLAVRILCTDLKSKKDRTVVAVITDGYGDESVWTYMADGRCGTSREEEYDLVEIGPYDDFEIDDPVMVEDIGGQWRRRHFAGISSDGRPATWNNGCTSFTAIGVICAWAHCRRPTEAELKGAGTALMKPNIKVMPTEQKERQHV